MGVLEGIAASKMKNPFGSLTERVLSPIGLSAAVEN
jgi:hypothetical protein